jgi:hypothetical protein
MRSLLGTTGVWTGERSERNMFEAMRLAASSILDCLLRISRSLGWDGAKGHHLETIRTSSGSTYSICEYEMVTETRHTQWPLPAEMYYNRGDAEDVGICTTYVPMDSNLPHRTAGMQ